MMPEWIMNGIQCKKVCDSNWNQGRKEVATGSRKDGIWKKLRWLLQGK